MSIGIAKYMRWPPRCEGGDATYSVDVDVEGIDTRGGAHSGLAVSFGVVCRFQRLRPVFAAVVIVVVKVRSGFQERSWRGESSVPSMEVSNVGH